MSDSVEITRAFHFEEARIEWTDPDIAIELCEVVILPNGWVHTPETGGYYPPHEVCEVKPSAE